MPTEEKSVQRRLISFSNYSTCLTLPKKALEKLGWRRGDLISVEVDFEEARMIIHRGGGHPSALPRKVGPARPAGGPPEASPPGEPIGDTGSKNTEELRW